MNLRLMEFFEEDNGRRSSMRLYGFMLVSTGCFMLCFSLYRSPAQEIDASVIAAALMVIGSGLTGKAMQKKDELTKQEPMETIQEVKQ